MEDYFDLQVNSFLYAQWALGQQEHQLFSIYNNNIKKVLLYVKFTKIGFKSLLFMSTVKLFNIGTPEIIIVVVLKMEHIGFTINK